MRLPAPETAATTPGGVQTSQEWQERIKEIREKYQNQFGPQGAGVVAPTPYVPPMKGIKAPGVM